jgi:glycine/D-amino acid oxidase-like deaminating enzyme
MGPGKRIVICGGGAIGVAIAYFASRRGARPVVVERHEVAGAASGKSGGFLALDWCGGSPLDRLARRSFALHAELSAELGNPWGYRRLTNYGAHNRKVSNIRQLAGARRGKWSVGYLRGTQTARFRGSRGHCTWN